MFFLLKCIVSGFVSSCYEFILHKSKNNKLSQSNQLKDKIINVTRNTKDTDFDGNIKRLRKDKL